MNDVESTLKSFTKTYKDGCVRARMNVESLHPIHLHCLILRYWFSFGHFTLPQIHSRPSVIQSKLSILQVSEMKTTMILAALLACSLAAPSTMRYAKRQADPSQDQVVAAINSWNSNWDAPRRAERRRNARPRRRNTHSRRLIRRNRRAIRNSKPIRRNRM